MNVCFISNKHLTITYARIGQELEKAGHRIFWLSPSRRWTAYLVERGFDRGAILSLPDFAEDWQTSTEEASVEALADLERVSDLRIGNVVLMCRALNRRPRRLAYAYLAAARRHVEAFLVGNGIDVCFGEPTWGFEIITWMVCRKIGIRCLQPTSARIPGDRFAFFDSVPHRVVDHREVADSDRIWARQFLQEWKERPRKPSYNQVARPGLTFRRHWWRELWLGLGQRRLDRDDLTLWPVGQRIHHRLRMSWNTAMLSRRPPFGDAPAGERFVLLCLHQQPESTIDVFAAMHADQFHSIERLARLLPASHALWIKEHPDAIGDRSPSWYRRVAALPHVRLVKPGESTFDLMKRADLVVTAAGTVAFEAALLGVPAATFASQYYTPILAVDSDRHPDLLTWPIDRLLSSSMRRELPGEDRLVEFLAWLHAQSYDGFPYDPLTRAKVGRSEDDLGLEATAFVAFLDWPGLRASRGAPAMRVVG